MSGKRTKSAEDSPELAWRNGDAGFIGPVAPPMQRWFMRGCPKSAWEVEAATRRSLAQPVGHQFQLAF